MTITITTATPVDAGYWTDVYEHTRMPVVRLAAAAALGYRHDPDGIELAVKHLRECADWHESENMPAAYVAQHRYAADHLATYQRP